MSFQVFREDNHVSTRPHPLLKKSNGAGGEVSSTFVHVQTIVIDLYRSWKGSNLLTFSCLG